MFLVFFDMRNQKHTKAGHEYTRIHLDLSWIQRFDNYSNSWQTRHLTIQIHDKNTTQYSWFTHPISRSRKIASCRWGSTPPKSRRKHSAHLWISRCTLQVSGSSQRRRNQCCAFGHVKQRISSILFQRFDLLYNRIYYIIKNLDFTYATLQNVGTDR